MGDRELERLKNIGKERFLQGRTVEEVMKETGLPEKTVQGMQSWFKQPLG